MSTINSFTRRKAGFTLIELLIALLISGVLIAMTATIYTIFRKAITNDQAKADLSQNARVALDRISREVRQTPDIVTIFPANASDNSVAQPGEIQFEDGHAQDLSYERYYINGATLELDTIEYYFAYAPATRVHWNSIGNSGESPVKHVITTQAIADRLKSLTFYGNKPIQLIVTVTDGNLQTFQLRTNIYERNT